jgi:mitotic spindle assembly checkpoint protein MAD2
MTTGTQQTQMQLTKSAVTLKGSAQMVSEFFNFGINSILYQRGIYPPENFKRVQEYGLTLLVSTDEAVNKFMKDVLDQIKDWLVQRKVKKLVVVLTEVDTKEVLEKWEFQVEYEVSEDKDGVKRAVDEGVKDEKKIKNEIRDVIRQITASVTFLPLLDCLCSFDVLIYTHKDLAVPTEWGESEPCIISNSEEVKLRSFSTSVHRVEAAVSYKADL